jgi:hypothetical protein
VPGLPQTKANRTVNPEAEALLAAMAGYRVRAAARGHSIERRIAVYEAGWSIHCVKKETLRKIHGKTLHFGAFPHAMRLQPELGLPTAVGSIA